MKILWVSHFVPFPPKAGVLIRGHFLVKELAKHHEVHLLAFNQRNLMVPYFESYEAGTQKAREVLSEYLPRIEILNLPVDSGSFTKHWTALKSLFTRYPYTINWTESRVFTELLERMHSEEQYDLIHFDTISFAPLMPLAKKAAVSLDHHNVESHMLIRRAKMESNPIKRWYFMQEGKRLKKIEQQACFEADTNISCSELDNARFREFIPNAEFTCIPNGVDTKFFYPGNQPPTPNRLIFIGTLDWYPNTKAVRFLANEIWQALGSERDQLELHIIGSRPPEDLKQLARQDSRIKVHGFVDEIIPELHQATIYVCPITDGGGTKLKLLDAFSSGKAVVAHPIACEGLMVTDEQDVLLADTAEDFSRQIKRLLNDSRLRQTLERNARKHVEDHFSFSAIGKTLADHFSQTVTAKGK